MPQNTLPEIPRVDAPFMNRVHDEEAELLERLKQQLAAVRAGEQELNALDPLVDELLTHMIEHFEREERLMQQIGFPPYPMHKSAHDEVLEATRGVVDAWKKQPDAELLDSFFLQQLPQWLEQHIATMDFVTARFLVGSGIDLPD
jgi:hemerythrin